MDSGKGHLRMILTMYDEEDILPVHTMSRVTREEGIGGGTGYKLTGRRKIMIIASAPKVPENHHNCSIFIDKANINSLVYKFTGDLKLYNIVGGLMSSSAKHPCIYCEECYFHYFIDLSELKNPNLFNNCMRSAMVTFDHLNAAIRTIKDFTR